jgi:hypothetical protein
MFAPARCPQPVALAGAAPTPENTDDAECPWLFVDLKAQQCVTGDAACRESASSRKEGNDKAGTRRTVQALEVQQGLCNVILEADQKRQQARERGEHHGEPAAAATEVYGVAFTHEDPETLRHVSDLDEVDVVALEGCEKAARSGARWHTIKVQLQPMASAGKICLNFLLFILFSIIIFTFRSSYNSLSSRTN